MLHGFCLLVIVGEGLLSYWIYLVFDVRIIVLLHGEVYGPLPLLHVGKKPFQLQTELLRPPLATGSLASCGISITLEGKVVSDIGFPSVEMKSFQGQRAGLIDNEKLPRAKGRLDR